MADSVKCFAEVQVDDASCSSPLHRCCNPIIERHQKFVFKDVYILTSRNTYWCRDNHSHSEGDQGSPGYDGSKQQQPDSISRAQLRMGYARNGCRGHAEGRDGLFCNSQHPQGKVGATGQSWGRLCLGGTKWWHHRPEGRGGKSRVQDRRQGKCWDRDWDQASPQVFVVPPLSVSGWLCAWACQATRLRRWGAVG